MDAINVSPELYPIDRAPEPLVNFETMYKRLAKPDPLAKDWRPTVLGLYAKLAKVQAILPSVQALSDSESAMYAAHRAAATRRLFIDEAGAVIGLAVEAAVRLNDQGARDRTKDASKFAWHVYSELDWDAHEGDAFRGDEDPLGVIAEAYLTLGRMAILWPPAESLPAVNTQVALSIPHLARVIRAAVKIMFLLDFTKWDIKAACDPYMQGRCQDVP